MSQISDETSNSNAQPAYFPISDTALDIMLKHTETINRITNQSSFQSVLRLAESGELNNIKNYAQNILESGVVQNYLSKVKDIYPILEKVLKAQQVFKSTFHTDSFLEIQTDYLSQINNQWVENLIDTNGITEGLNYKISVSNKESTFNKSYVLDLSDGVDIADSTFHGIHLVNGELRGVISKPISDREEVSFDNPISSVILQNKDINLVIASNIEKIENTNSETNIKQVLLYDEKSATIIVGQYNISITRYGFVHRSLCTMTRNKANRKKVWYFSDLIEIQDIRELDSANSIKKAKDTFYYILKKLPEEIRDLFIVKAKYVYINEKYI